MRSTMSHLVIKPPNHSDCANCTSTSSSASPSNGSKFSYLTRPRQWETSCLPKLLDVPKSCQLISASRFWQWQPGAPRNLSTSKSSVVSLLFGDNRCICAKKDGVYSEAALLSKSFGTSVQQRGGNSVGVGARSTGHPCMAHWPRAMDQKFKAINAWLVCWNPKM